MTNPYHQQLLNERTESRKVSRTWLQCYLAQTPPTFEHCKKHFESEGMILSKTDYEDICEKMCMKPQFRASANECKRNAPNDRS